MRADINAGQVWGVRDRIEHNAMGRRIGEEGAYRQQFGHIALGFFGKIQRPIIGGPTAALVFADSAGNGAFPGIVGSQGVEPVTVKVFVQVLKVVQCGAGGFGHVAAPVIPPGLAQAEAPAGTGDELPQTGGAAVGVGKGLEGAFDYRQQGDFQRHLTLVEFLDNQVHVRGRPLDNPLKIGGMALEPVQVGIDPGMLVVQELKAVAQAGPDIPWLLTIPDKNVLACRLGSFRRGSLGCGIVFDRLVCDATSQGKTERDA